MEVVLMRDYIRAHCRRGLVLASVFLASFTGVKALEPLKPREPEMMRIITAAWEILRNPEFQSQVKEHPERLELQAQVLRKFSCQGLQAVIKRSSYSLFHIAQGRRGRKAFVADCETLLLGLRKAREYGRDAHLNGGKNDWFAIVEKGLVNKGKITDIFLQMNQLTSREIIYLAKQLGCPGKMAHGMAVVKIEQAAPFLLRELAILLRTFKNEPSSLSNRFNVRLLVVLVDRLESLAIQIVDQKVRNGRFIQGGNRIGAAFTVCLREVSTGGREILAGHVVSSLKYLPEVSVLDKLEQGINLMKRVMPQLVKVAPK